MLIIIQEINQFYAQKVGIAPQITMLKNAHQDHGIQLVELLVLSFVNHVLLDTHAHKEQAQSLLYVILTLIALQEVVLQSVALQEHTLLMMVRSGQIIWLLVMLQTASQIIPENTIEINNAQKMSTIHFFGEVQLMQI